MTTLAVTKVPTNHPSWLGRGMSRSESVARYHRARRGESALRRSSRTAPRDTKVMAMSITDRMRPGLLLAGVVMTMTG